MAVFACLAVPSLSPGFWSGRRWEPPLGPPPPAPGLPGAPEAPALWQHRRCAGEGCGQLAAAEGRHARILITTSTGACQGPAAPANRRADGEGGKGARRAVRAGRAFFGSGAPEVERRRGLRCLGLLLLLPALSCGWYLRGAPPQGTCSLQRPLPAHVRAAQSSPRPAPGLHSR